MLEASEVKKNAEYSDIRLLSLCVILVSFFHGISLYPPHLTPVSLMHPFSLCLQHNLFSTEDIFNSLLRLASNRSGGVGGGRASEQGKDECRQREERQGSKGGGQRERQTEGEIMR